MRLTAPSAFAPAFALDLELGGRLALRGMHLPPRRPAALVPPWLEERLSTEERAELARHAEARAVDFAAGRSLAATCRAALGLAARACLPDEHGAPSFEEGVGGSLSHAPLLACAAVRRGRGLGVDVERVDRPKERILDKILLAEERERLPDPGAPERALAITAAFAVKEAVYKCIHPLVRRYVSFHECLVEEPTSREPGVTLLLRAGERFALEARVQVLEDDGGPSYALAVVALG